MNCPKCNTKNTKTAKFCIECGEKFNVAKRSTGKICPYCHSVIKPSSDVVVCEKCGTSHHKECWDENQGCAIYGCNDKKNNKTPKGLSIKNVPASKTKRFINLIIDYFATILFGFIFGLGIAFLGFNDFLQKTNENILGFLVVFLYYLFFESIFGKTVGKLITRTRVISLDNNKANFTSVLKRTLSRFIPFEAFSYLFDEKAIGWHDRISNTRVIEE